jgi:NAD(P)-dependent dehydrogenase (short-subunit alcohol dehydrogenase family)
MINMPSNATAPAALVTGASYGIGRAIAVGLARDGWDVVVTDLRTQDLSPVVADIQALGRHAVALALDLRQPLTFDDFMAAVGEHCPGLSVLVNNAGVSSLKQPAVDTQLTQWESVVDTNLKGTYFMTQTFGRWLIANARPGAIISLSSTHGSVGFPGASVYGIAKAGINQMTRMLAIEWAPHGIRLNAVAPGTTPTETRQASLENPNRREAMLSRIPLQRFGTVEEMAGAVCYLASPLASYITGQILHLDGGLTAY